MIGIVPNNSPQFILSSNGREESRDVVSKTPAEAYTPPIPFNPNTDLQFNTSERAERQFTWTNYNNTGVQFETPPTFNSSYANMTFRVMNSSWVNQTLVDSQTPGTSSTLEQAQGFNTTTDMILYGISISIAADNGVSKITTFSIREGVPWNISLSQKSIIMPNVLGWLFIPLDSPLPLVAGHYYVHMTAQTGATNKAKWNRTNNFPELQDCYNVTGTTWAPQPYNMTLKIHVKLPVDPQVEGMQVGGQPVSSLGIGLGWANLTSPITGTSLNYAVTPSTIEYAYQVNLTAYRISKAINAVNLTTGDANWTLTAFSYPGSNYPIYQGNITGFNENYQFIQAFFGEVHVGFNQSESFDTLIFTNPVDRITFQSPNYITGVEIQNQVHSGQNLDLNITAGDIGNISVNIYNESKTIYENYTMIPSSVASFHWWVNTTLYAGEYTFEATFFMPNQVGYFQQNITIVKVAAIDTYTLHTQALDLLRLNFRLYDFYSGSYISGANVHYHLSDLSGNLTFSDDTNNYTKNINLETYSMLPGDYPLTLEAEMGGYQSLLVPTSVVIVAREMDFEITRSADALNPGGTLEITLDPFDVVTDGSLVRPVGVTVKIYPTGGDADLDAIVSGTLRSISSVDSLSLAIPLTASLGSYDILIRVQSDFYTGDRVLTGKLTIVEPPNILVTILIVAAIAVSAAGAYVQRQRVVTKRSVMGAIVMNPGGMPIARKISPDFSTMNPHLISGAVMGIVTMVKEMTGSSIRTIALEGRYLKIVLRDAFWFVLLTKRNPSWISGIVKKCVADLEFRYGAEIAAWKGEGNVHVSLDITLKRWFGVEIKETREPELEMASDQNPSQPPSPPVPP